MVLDIVQKQGMLACQHKRWSVGVHHITYTQVSHANTLQISNFLNMLVIQPSSEHNLNHGSISFGTKFRAFSALVVVPFTKTCRPPSPPSPL